MSLDLFKKIFGEKLITDAEKQLTLLKEEWDSRYEQNCNDHKYIGEILKEINERLEKIEKKK